MQPTLLGLLLLAWAAAAQDGPEQSVVSVQPENPVVEFGRPLTLNCSTNCRNAVSGGLETHLDKQLVGEGRNWKTFRLLNVSYWDPVPSCYFDCRSDPNMKPHRVNLTVYRVPTLVELDPVPVMEAGQNYTLTCRVSNVAPIRNLSVSFLKGGERLYTETFERHAAREADNRTVNHTVTARRWDHGEAISCRAALDLRPDGPFIEESSGNQMLKAVVFPSDPQLSRLHYVEVNTSQTVTCEVTGVFPAEEARFELTFAGERLTSDVTVSGDTARAEAQISPSGAGIHPLKCTVSLGPVTKTAEDTVNVYSLPDLVLTISPQEALVNNSVDIVCLDSHPEKTQPQTFSSVIRNSKQVLKSGDGLPLRAGVTAAEEDDGQEFTCEVEVEVDGRLFVRKMSADLTVYYGPQVSDSTCPRNLTWKAGSQEVLNCSFRGNPSPNVTCSKDGVLYPLLVPQLITADHGGTYNCSAFNAHGSVTAFVTVHVEVYEIPGLLIGLLILGAVVLGTIVGVGYYMHYKAHKIRKYRLEQRKAQGTPSEQKCLNGKVQTDSV
ncbi:intercellular adhesion molecule 1 [Paroedura picta]|uniref:intercellular adhesion molecule 1 n=1 Tax=Paroedura picta TaxID=143630 RepID=UPI004055CDB3